jgi:hypothetical protein
MAYTSSLDFDEDFILAYRIFKFDVAVFERCAGVCVDKSFGDHRYYRIRIMNYPPEEDLARSIDVRTGAHSEDN